MKKTTYTKSFTGWGYTKDSASNVGHNWSFPTKGNELGLYASESTARRELEKRWVRSIAGEPVKIKITYTVTVEPVK